MSRLAANSPDAPIGVFDSGLGGLGMVAALNRLLPHEKIVYLGDTARLPYGDKSAETIIRFARQDVSFLLGKGVKLCVAACNSVSSVAMEALRADFPDAGPIGVIDAGVRAVLAAGARRIAVIGTRATINSGAHLRALKRLAPEAAVTGIATPLLVPLAEEGIFSGPIVRHVLEYYFGGLKRDNPPEALLLGCTHYTSFQPMLREFFGNGVVIADSNTVCADFVAEYLARRHLSAPAGKIAQSEFYVTDFPQDFRRHAGIFLGRDPGEVHKVEF